MPESPGFRDVYVLAAKNKQQQRTLPPSGSKDILHLLLKNCWCPCLATTLNSHGYQVFYQNRLMSE